MSSVYDIVNYEKISESENEECPSLLEILDFLNIPLALDYTLSELNFEEVTKELEDLKLNFSNTPSPSYSQSGSGHKCASITFNKSSSPMSYPDSSDSDSSDSDSSDSDSSDSDSSDSDSSDSDFKSSNPDGESLEDDDSSLLTKQARMGYSKTSNNCSVPKRFTLSSEMDSDIFNNSDSDSKSSLQSNIST
jgi:hypothetical protein